MKSNRVSVTLPILLNGVSVAVDVGSGAEGFAVQFVGVAAAAASSYALSGSVDGATWTDLTNHLLNLGTGAALSAPVAADSLCDYPARFPGLVRFVCKTAPTSPPTTAPVAWVGYQDTSQA